MSLKSSPEYAQAHDPATSPQRLGQIADSFPELHEALLDNPSCPPDVRQWILSTNTTAREAWEEKQLPASVPSPPPLAPGAGPFPGGPVPAPQARSKGSGARWFFILLGIVFVLWVLYSCASFLDSLGSTSSQDRRTVSPEATESPVEMLSPPPADAVEATLVDTHSQNISCELHDDQVACSIATRYYGEMGLPDCDSDLFSITLSEGTPELACGQSFLGTPGQHVTRLEYGQTATFSNYACTARETGMTCWNTYTGHGFTLARETQITF